MGSNGITKRHIRYISPTSCYNVILTNMRSADFQHNFLCCYSRKVQNTDVIKLLEEAVDFRFAFVVWLLVGVNADTLLCTPSVT
jgi:hypothetical protein